MTLIYNYLDYREFLRSLLKDKKAENPKFSHRYILRRMNIASSGYLLNVIAGKSSLNIQRVAQIGGILNLSRGEVNYFRKLVYFDKAKTVDEKNDYYQQIMDHRKRKVTLLSGEQFSLFSEWYFVVIREILHVVNFKDDYGALARMVTPSVTKSEAKKAIASLESLRLIARNDEGFFKPVDKAIATGDEITVHEVCRYQAKMITLAQFALESVPLKHREISGLTLSISDDKFQLIKSEIQEFRKKILQIASNDPKPERVFRCNFHLFPVSDEIGRVE